MNREWLRTGLRWSLSACGVSATLAIIAGVLQGALSAAGDLDGASAVRGVLLVAMTGIGISAIAMIALLAWIELHRD